MGTTFRSPIHRIVTPVVASHSATPGVDAVADAAEITQGMVYHDTKRYEDFDALIARANFVLPETLKARVVMATMMMLSLAQKWTKLANDYGLPSNVWLGGGGGG